jgi:aspartate/methionine/tyrosine aminotransferase
MQWAKARPEAPIDLALSSVVACTLDHLPGAREALALGGRNDDGYAPLVGAIATRYGVAPECVATATGTSGANFLCCLALLEPGDEVVVETPAYDPLLAVTRSLGARVRRFERRLDERFTVDPGRVAAEITPATRLVILTQPHNPSGALIEDSVIEEIAAAAARHGAWVLADEVYLDAARGCGAPPAARLAENIISTNSLTKSYGLASLRCGWAIAAPAIVERIRRARDLVDGTGSIVAERLSVIAFGNLESLADRARAILQPNVRAAREWLEATEQLEGFIPVATVAFPRLRGGGDASALCERLLRVGVAVVPGRFFEAPAHFRIGLGIPREALATGLKQIAALADR